MNIEIPSESRACQVCGKDASRTDLIAASSVSPVVVNVISKDYPQWSAEGFICADDLNRFRYDYARSLIVTERGELSDLEKAVVESLASHEIQEVQIELRTKCRGLGSNPIKTPDGHSGFKFSKPDSAETESARRLKRPPHSRKSGVFGDSQFNQNIFHQTPFCKCGL